MLKSNKTFMVFIRTAKQRGASSEQEEEGASAPSAARRSARSLRGEQPMSDHAMSRPLKAQFITILVGLSFIAVGVEHFRNPGLFVPIVPPFLPAPLELVYISGFFEVAGGLGLLWSRTRRLAGWGLLALLVAVYPANIYMLVADVYIDGMARERWLLWARMPLQFVIAAGVLVAADIWRPGRGAIEPPPQNV